MEFKRMLHPNKFRKRSKQLELWKLVTLASYYEKLMESTRPCHVGQAVIYMRELDAASYHIDSIIETLDQLIDEVDDEIGCNAENFEKSWITKTDALENGLYQLSVQLQRQEKAITDVADHFSERMVLISAMRDNFKGHESLIRKHCVFHANMLTLTNLIRSQCGKMIAPAKERWSVRDLGILARVVDELNKIIVNFVGLRRVRELIAPTNLPDENDIMKLVRQAEKLRLILEVDESVIKPQH
ncbi:unnamed protein product [Litomosoides sigmodontis]|uniref:Uncharacterized protein n=1 Tax=Litomosoides sigmodontis TaxID=42156 RepID=A0A3P6U3T1_LITSI|nr:unnamed protein product [Litomosoides sigmodontis]